MKRAAMVRSPVNWYRRVRHALIENRRLCRAYFSSTDTPSLHIGGGWRRLEGWLNADLEVVPGVVNMDATKPFPFADVTFRFVFSEHMIEHVPYEGGVAMLRECHRILRDDGVIRVVTPDLASIAALYSSTLSDAQKEYLSWFCAACLPQGRPHTVASAMNAQFRFWGHQFVYDEETLATALLTAGFTSITRKRLGQSNHPELAHLENVQRYPEGFLDIESVALEASK